MATTLYGLRTCDTVKKARSWLDARSLAYRFHDLRADGLDPATLRLWTAALGWQALLNRAGTTFRALPDAEKAELDQEKALALMLAQPALVKRPVLDRNGEISVGFKPERYAGLFA